PRPHRVQRPPSPLPRGLGPPRARGTHQRHRAVHPVCRRRGDRRAAGDRARAPGRRPDHRAGMRLLEAKIVAARAVGSLARRAGRGGGTSLPGKVLLALEPDAIRELSARLSRGSLVISATNGKTTSAAMVAAVMARAGVPVVHNRAGANMAGGVASTLVAAARPGGAISGDLGLFEVDEFWLDRV